MKKFLVLLLLVLLFTSCDKKPKRVEDNIEMTTFQYRGHSYIEFKDKNSFSFTFIHDPDCKKCLNMFD